MAIEALRFASQYISNSEYVKSHMNNNNNNGQQIGISGGCFPVTVDDRNLQFIDPISSFNNSESVPNNNLKRERDSTFDSDALIASQKRRTTAVSPAPLIDAELAFQIEQQNSEINRFVAQQTETLRLELEARQRRQTLMLAAAVQNACLKKLKAKDEEIIRMVKLNWVLEERAKNLCVEIQIWRDLAQTNEATANTLRSNLQQAVAQVDELDQAFRQPLVKDEDDAESSCGSCSDEEKLTVVNGGCKRCGDLTASVLVLPCRHLCLCTVCGSSASLQTCPVCDMTMNASVHVNMST